MTSADLERAAADAILARFSLPVLDPEKVARAFHENYERLAPEFDYKTRERSAVPWGDVPADNRELMVATVNAVLAALPTLTKDAEA